jgi:acid stress chaperone HdeB
MRIFAIMVFALVMTGIPEKASAVEIDMATITCGEFILMEPDKIGAIAMWLSGFAHAKANSTVFDTQKALGMGKRVGEYCSNNPEITVMKAGEQLLDK